ncbi:MAG: hypothetical protein PHC51_12715 [bacterium]|nr:hypothetical protein [bacterium]
MRFEPIWTGENVLFNFTHVETEQVPGPAYDPEACCAEARSIEQLIYNWVTGDKSLVFSSTFSFPDLFEGEKTLGISFFENKQIVGYASTAIKELERYYGSIPRLRENVNRFADGDDYSPDLEWFEQRNERLNLHDNGDDDHLHSPAESIVELVLSYGLSSSGFAQLVACKSPATDTSEDLLADNPSTAAEMLIQAELVFLGGPDGKGWEESVILSRADLLGFCRILARCVSGYHNC